MNFEITTSIDWEKNIIVSVLRDYDFDYEQTKTYKIDQEVYDTFGAKYIDNLIIFMTREASEQLAKNRKESRNEIENVYEQEA